MNATIYIQSDISKDVTFVIGTSDKSTDTSWNIQLKRTFKISCKDDKCHNSARNNGD